MKLINAYLLPIFLVIVIGGCRSSKIVSIPEGVAVVTREQWGSAKPVLEMKEHVPNRITIHHTGTYQNFNKSLEEKLKALQKFSMERSPLSDGRTKEAWADIPYHFYISVDGRIGEGRELRYVGDSNTPYDPTGHALLVLEGNFNKDQVTEAQRQSLFQLTKAIAKRYHISADRISGHKDNAQTACPGDALYAMLPQLREAVVGK